MPLGRARGALYIEALGGCMKEMLRVVRKCDARGAPLPDRESSILRISPYYDWIWPRGCNDSLLHGQDWLDVACACCLSVAS